MNETTDLQKLLTGFELYVLPRYDKYLQEQREDDEEYATGIIYTDDKHSFYQWLDAFSWKEMIVLIEEYANELAEVKKASNE